MSLNLVTVSQSLPTASKYEFSLIAVDSIVADYHSDSVDNTHFAEQKQRNHHYFLLAKMMHIHSPSQACNRRNRIRRHIHLLQCSCLHRP